MNINLYPISHDIQMLNRVLESFYDHLNVPNEKRYDDHRVAVSQMKQDNTFY